MVAAVLAVLVLGPFWAGRAEAHKLRIFAFAESGEIRGTVFFGGNVKARGARVIAIGPDDRILAETNSDEDGTFAIPVVERVDHRIVADARDGHRAEAWVRASELPAGLRALGAARARPAEAAAPSAGSVSPTATPSVAEVERIVEAAVARQVAPLRADIESYEDQVRWRDVAGGLGYILGVTGLALSLVARRRRREWPGP